MDPTEEVASLLGRSRRGDESARDQLLERVYGELRRVAGRYLRRERRDHTLQATALVHEAWIRLSGAPSGAWEDRAQFLSAAATAMRRILVNHALRRQALKRGGGLARAALLDPIGVFEERAEDLVALDEALDRLARLDARKARIVELRFFGGLSEEETAHLLEVSSRTIEREWRLARAWLRKELEG
jgi:RNA polymerase sigma-70 factor (ECF subfamily)